MKTRAPVYRRAGVDPLNDCFARSAAMADAIAGSEGLRTALANAICRHADEAGVSLVEAMNALLYAGEAR